MTEVQIKLEINAVAYPEDGAWIVQGLEYDIAAHALDVADLPDAFVRAVVEHAILTQMHGRKPLEGLKKAPERFHRMFEEARAEVRPVDAGDRHLSMPIGAIRLAQGSALARA